MKIYFIYILASKKHGILYIGVTNNLKRRIYEHKNGIIEGFTKRYFVKNLVWYDSTDSIESALTREKQMKLWKREWKINIIEKNNPEWKDLSDNL